MAGEFLQLLASLERQKMAEVDAEHKIVTSLITAKNAENARAHESNLNRQHSANMKVLGVQLTENAALDKEILLKEAALKDLGVQINQYKEMKDDDKTPEAESLLQLTYKNEVSGLSDLNMASKDMGGKISSLEEQNDTLINRISELDKRKREFDAVNESLKNFSSELFEDEYDQPTGDWEIDEGELAKFVANNVEDYDQVVDQFGGGEEGKAEVDMRLRRHFSKFTKEKMETLNDVLSVQKEKLNIAKLQQELGLLPPAATKTAEAMKEAFDASIGEFTGNASFLGSKRNFSPTEIADDPILGHILGSTVPDRSGLAGAEAYMVGIETNMAQVIRQLNDVNVYNQIPSQFQNDTFGMAKYYSGQIVSMERWLKEPENKGYAGTYDYEIQGKKYMNVLDPGERVAYAEQRMSELDLSAWEMSNPDNIKYGLMNFFTEYSTSKKSWNQISNQRNVIEGSFGVSLSASTAGNKQQPESLDGSGKALSTDKDRQSGMDESLAVMNFAKDNNMDFTAVMKNASENDMSVLDYIESQGSKAKTSTLSFEDAENMYYGGEEYKKAGTAKSSERGADIIKRLEKINSEKERNFDEYMHQLGDEIRQKEAKDRWFNTGSMGSKWEILHEEGADLVDELRVIRSLAERLGIKDDENLWSFHINNQKEWLGGDKDFIPYSHRPHSVNPEWDYIDYANKEPVLPAVQVTPGSP